MISKYSTIPVPDSLQALRKIISFALHFWRTSFVPDDANRAELSDDGLNERM